MPRKVTRIRSAFLNTAFDNVGSSWCWRWRGRNQPILCAVVGMVTVGIGVETGDRSPRCGIERPGAVADPEGAGGNRFNRVGDRMIRRRVSDRERLGMPADEDAIFNA